jgi:hypothetical protein
MPDLEFGTMDAEVLSYAAAPTILFKLPIHNVVEEEEIHSIMLRAQIRLEVTRRHYNHETEDRLVELLVHRNAGADPAQYGLDATAFVPRFTGGTVAEVPIVCSYDFEVAASKYFYALEDGDVPSSFSSAAPFSIARAMAPYKSLRYPGKGSAVPDAGARMEGNDGPLLPQ